MLMDIAPIISIFFSSESSLEVYSLSNIISVNMYIPAADIVYSKKNIVLSLSDIVLDETAELVVEFL